MVNGEAVRGPRGRVVVMDSITKLTPADAGAFVVCGSHGGTSSAEFALQVPLRLVVFSDAGVGKDRAGIAALAILQEAGVAAAAVSHLSARIGDARDQWETGIVSYVNEHARALGVIEGVFVQQLLRALIG